LIVGAFAPDTLKKVKNDFARFEHRRIPYALGAGDKILFPDDALYDSGYLRCPICQTRVVLVSVSCTLSFTHMLKSPMCPFSRRGSEWALPSAVYSVYGRIKSFFDAHRPENLTVLRRCYTCRSVRSTHLPKTISIVNIKYDPFHGESRETKPEIILTDSQHNPSLLIFVVRDEKTEIPPSLRKLPSYLVKIQSVLEDSRTLTVFKSYSLRSPSCPCQKADEIKCEDVNGQSSLVCPIVDSDGNSPLVPMAKCLHCSYHLSLFKDTVTCGFTVGIHRTRKSGVGFSGKNSSAYNPSKREHA